MAKFFVHICLDIDATDKEEAQEILDEAVKAVATPGVEDIEVIFALEETE